MAASGFQVPHGPDYHDSYFLGDQVNVQWTWTQSCRIDLRLQQINKTTSSDFLIVNASSLTNTYTWISDPSTDLTDPDYKFALGCNDDLIDFVSSPAFTLKAKPGASNTTQVPAGPSTTSVASFPFSTGSSSSTASSSASSLPDSSNGLSLTAKLGISIGAPLVGLIVGVYGYVMLRYYRRRRALRAVQPPAYEKHDTDESMEGRRGSPINKSPVDIILRRLAPQSPAGHEYPYKPENAHDREVHLIDSTPMGELEGTTFAELEGDWPIPQQPPTPPPPPPLRLHRRTPSKESTSPSEAVPLALDTTQAMAAVQAAKRQSVVRVDSPTIPTLRKVTPPAPVARKSSMPPTPVKRTDSTPVTPVVSARKDSVTTTPTARKNSMPPTPVAGKNSVPSTPTKKNSTPTTPIGRRSSNSSTRIAKKDGVGDPPDW